MDAAIDARVLASLGGILSLLLTSSGVMSLFTWLRPQHDYSEVKRRIATWWVLATAFAAALALHRMVSLAFAATISFLALREFLSLIPTRRVDRRVLVWAYLAIPLQYLWIAMEWYGMFIVFIPVYLFLFLPMRMVMKGEARGFLHAAGTLHWGLMTTVFSLSHAAYLLVLPARADFPGGGIALAVFLVVLTQLNDVAQFLWGKALGRHRGVVAVSPNKTLEGLLGGLMTTIALASLMGPWMTPLSSVQSLCAGVIIGLGGFVGDVTMSAIKRDLGIKDSGTLLPGHGGILDRVDSLTYTAPLFFHFIYYLSF